ncbi:MAG: SUMF1/EgtB/PvdO family nonheme iron enzyme, partial [Nitrospinaceae bacterium]|nr:SUMF1/EgtB/PvdO family nonheme iron enzyme [Nitrospinaceae bacterium]
MVLIPEGEYIAGSDDSADERPKREIYLDAFYIDKFEVTQKEFA